MFKSFSNTWHMAQTIQMFNMLIHKHSHMCHNDNMSEQYAMFSVSVSGNIKSFEKAIFT